MSSSQSRGGASSTFASSRSENSVPPSPTPPWQSIATITEQPAPVSSSGDSPTNLNKGIASLAIGGTTACLAGLLGISMGVWLYLRGRGRLPWHKGAPDLGSKNHARPLLYVRPIRLRYPLLLTAHPLHGEPRRPQYLSTFADISGRWRFEAGPTVIHNSDRDRSAQSSNVSSRARWDSLRWHG